MPKRVLVVKNGKVIKGKESLFDDLVRKEAGILKRIWRRMIARGEAKPRYAPYDFLEDAKQSLLSAACRLGTGSIWVTLPVKKKGNRTKR